MEERQGVNKLRRSAGDSLADRTAVRIVNREMPAISEDASPEVARENIVKEMMRIFDGLLGCTSKRTGVNLASIKTTLKSAAKDDKPKKENGSQRKLEKEIYQLIKGLVELDSPNTGFAINVLFNNGNYYYNKANVPLSFGIFLNSLVEFLEGHDCLSIYPEELVKLKTLLNRG
ncbi:MAG: hypothetical protein HGB32_07115 [Geobacteraceae bacterium]|nr:hypothetical protein [Geobacteraceae bacterium]NTW79902.1 hypothetical protein [Geobacteraceae bacterium]